MGLIIADGTHLKNQAARHQCLVVEKPCLYQDVTFFGDSHYGCCCCLKNNLKKKKDDY